MISLSTYVSKLHYIMISVSTHVCNLHYDISVYIYMLITSFQYLHYIYINKYKTYIMVSVSTIVNYIIAVSTYICNLQHISIYIYIYIYMCVCVCVCVCVCGTYIMISVFTHVCNLHYDISVYIYMLITSFQYLHCIYK